MYERFDAEQARFPGVQMLRGDKGMRLRTPGGEATRPISPKLSDLGERGDWMDRIGIDQQRPGGF